MPNLKSAKKRMRGNAVARARNAGVRTRINKTRRQFMEAAEKQDQAAMETAFSSYCSALDKAAKKRVIKKNNAIRRKSRAAMRMRATI